MFNKSTERYPRLLWGQSADNFYSAVSRAFSVTVVLFCVLQAPAFGKADVVLLRTAGDHGVDEDAIRAVSSFYGLSFESISLAASSRRISLPSDLRDRQLVAAIVSADAINRVDPHSMFAALQRPNGRHIPLIVIGIGPEVASKRLELWSNGTVHDCVPLDTSYRAQMLEVQRLENLTGVLGGIQVPATTSPECILNFDTTPALQPALVSSSEGGKVKPVTLLRISQPDREVFFTPTMRAFVDDHIGVAPEITRAFSSLAEYLIFLSHAAGDRAWHFDGQYANFTVDDPWLREPYGNLNYHALLAEMEKHNFHTTIAFIPWNFDRSERQVVSLFRQHPDRFSICLHGNNHSHQEFGDYDRNPLEQQRRDIKQGVARMEKFRSLTGVTYDRFMVFPHAVAPEATLQLLAKYGFSGTANSSNVPMHMMQPKDLVSLFRPSSNVYGHLLSLLRLPVVNPVPESQLAIRLFFGGPLLFYAHENLFGANRVAFDPYADLVNQLRSDVKWASLGEIARHSYLLRRNSEDGFDVMMFSSEMDLVNPEQEERDFSVTNIANTSQATLTVDNYPAVLSRTGEGNRFHLLIPAHSIRKVRFLEPNDLNVVSEDIRTNDVYAYSLRLACDFRDLYLSRASFGSVLIREYYFHRWDKLELYLESRWFWLGAAFLLFIVAIRIRRSVGARTSPAPGRTFRGDT